MKKFIIAALAIFVLAACNKEDKVKFVNVRINVSEANLAQGTVVPDSYTVTLKNIGTGQSFSATTERIVAKPEESETEDGAGNEENGEASLASENENQESDPEEDTPEPGVKPDDVFAELSVLAGTYNVTVTGQVADCSFSGNLSNVSILSDSELEVNVEAVKKSSLIFKEIYYTGCKYVSNPETQATSTYFRDQFYEIYNNSDETVYLDGLYITTLFGVNTNADYTYPIVNPENYLFAQDQIWQIPGTPGTDKNYPLAPGESIIIAQWATDHTASGNAPGSSLNLLGAEFEAMGDVFSATGRTDNPAINMNFISYLGTSTKIMQWFTSAFGCYYVIFFADKPISQDDDKIVATYMTGKYPVIPIKKSWIIDGVEALKNDAAIQLKKYYFPDAGYVICSGTYVGESIARKVASTAPDGRKIYQDTNNSTNDFEVSKTPTLRRDGAKVPSWNTWINGSNQE